MFLQRPIIFVFLCMLWVVSPAAENSNDSLRVQEILDQYTTRESTSPIRQDARWRAPQSVVMFLPGYANVPIADFEAWLASAAPDAKVRYVTTQKAFARAAKTADVAILGNCSALDPGMKNLRWVQRFGVGVERCLAQKFDWSEGVLLTNTRGMSGPFIAEHAITMALMLTHAMPQYYRNQMAGEWSRSRKALAGVRPVNGSRLLVVGLGGIGTKVAEKGAALGMRVNAVRNSKREGPAYVEYVGLSDELLKLAADADFVVNTLPLTPETQGLFDARFFDTMKNSAYFITVGRGGSVVTDDLVAALKSGAIAGAGLDVTDPEPLPASHPLWRLPNVIITPHSSSVSGRGSPDVFEMIRENLRRYAAGEKMLNVVDPALGY